MDRLNRTTGNIQANAQDLNHWLGVRSKTSTCKVEQEGFGGDQNMGQTEEHGYYKTISQADALSKTVTQ